MSSAFSVVALVAAYNEADVIHHVIADLIDQGVDVYFLDDGSTDETVRIVERFAGRGVLDIERLPPAPGRAAADAPRPFDWERILRRKSQLAAALEADWFIHHDADEFRESPWRHLSLRDAIQQVDAHGFNAIDFAGFDFWPVDDRFRPGDDVRKALTLCSALADYDRIQIRCWKKTAQVVDLVSSGGHEAKFPERSVFPLRFILRHYPIRSQAHGESKVFHERRFLERERARGWHVQYDDVPAGTSFLRDPALLTPYDADAVRIGLTLNDRRVEALQQALDSMPTELARTRAELAAITKDAEALREALERRTGDLEATRGEAAAQAEYAATLTDALERRAADIEQWRSSVESLTRQLNDVRLSLSWRLTAPARAVLRALRGR